MMRSYQRIFLIVIDSLGISGAPDAAGKGRGGPAGQRLCVSRAVASAGLLLLLLCLNRRTIIVASASAFAVFSAAAFNRCGNRRLTRRRHVYCESPLHTRPHCTLLYAAVLNRSKPRQLTRR